MGETTLDEYIALSDLSMAYIGMDTLNMHIAAGQNKSIFAIFGPTLPQVWSPWSNRTQSYAKESKTVQTYGNVTLFQANMPCVACGLAGCDDRGGKSDCLYMIDPNTIFKEVSKCLARSL
jgi:heptosyltransferase-3